MSRKTTVTWKVPEHASTDHSPRTDTHTEQYVYSNTFEDSANEPVYTDTFVDGYTDTFVDDSYSDTFINDGTTTIKTDITDNRTSYHTARPGRGEHTVSFADSDTSIGEATYLETGRNVSLTDVLETVLEVDSDLSRSQDLNTVVSDTHPPTSYTDTFETVERTELDSQEEYDTSQYTLSYQSSGYSRSRSKRGRSFYTDEDDSTLDHSFIAPDYNGKSLSDEEETDSDDTFNDDYSYTFEESATTSHLPSAGTDVTSLSPEEAKQTEQAKRLFTQKMIERLKGGEKKNYSQLETLPPDPRDEEPEEDEYLKHFCKKKIKMIIQKKHIETGQSDDSEPHPLARQRCSSTLADFGVPEAVLDRAKIHRVLSAMKKAAREEIHEPSKCLECRTLKEQFETEEAERRFVKSHIMRLKSKVVDAKVEDHLLKMNSVSLIAEIARNLPLHTEKPEKILDKLFEPLLGKNVMR